MGELYQESEGRTVRFVILVILAGWLAGCSAAEQPRPPAPSPQAVLETRSPEEVAATFLAALQRRDLRAVHESFSAALRERLSEDEFQLVAEEWLKEPQVQWELPAREIVPDGSLESPLRLSVRLARETPRPDWTLVLVEEEDGSWKIDDWKGGPLR
jgi:hypothetical protein